MCLVTGEIVGFMDADYKTPIDEIEKVLPLLDAGYDLVAGSRGLGDSKIEVYQPRYRQIGSWAFGKVMHTLIGLHHIRDTQCGFKFFTRACADADLQPDPHRRLHVRRRDPLPCRSTRLLGQGVRHPLAR